MHLTLKQETTRPPGANTLQQQDHFDRFVSEFNEERPHEALAMRMPAELYTQWKLAHPTGFEPVTFGIGIQHSIQLSYGCIRWRPRPPKQAVSGS